eukprot:229255_1
MDRILHLMNHLDKRHNYKTLLPSHTRDTTSYQAVPLSHIYPNTVQILQQIFHNRYNETIPVLEKHGRDINDAARTSPPNAVIFPQTKQEIIDLIKLCNSHKPKPIAIVPYSAGTALEGHITASPNRTTISISFAKMNQILSIYPNDMMVTVQPGIGFMKLNKQLQKYKLLLGCDPSPSACIGGMIATCCSGPSAIRYGTMRNQVINLTIVLANGTVIKTGQRAIKSVAGYDLNGLFIGSEGTLGIIIEATLRLRPMPVYIEIAQAAFECNDWFSIGECIKEINLSGVVLAAFEFMDNLMVNDCKKYDPKANLIENKNIILFKFSGPTKEHISADINVIKNIVQKYSKYPFVWSKTEKERRILWNIRKNSFWANKFANPGKNSISTDVAVPYSNFSECIKQCKMEMDKSVLYAPIVGHIGDGNWHASIWYDARKEEQVKEVHRLMEYIVNCALELNGTCTAEHGVGKNKKKFLYKELGHNAVEFMKSLKKHIDPNGILCPGNVVDV